jgi:hypothetical protein
MTVKGNKTKIVSHQLRVCIVRRGYFDEVRRNYFQAIQAPQDSAQLACGPTTGLGCSSGRCERGVNGINLRKGSGSEQIQGIECTLFTSIER